MSENSDNNLLGDNLLRSKGSGLEITSLLPEHSDIRQTMDMLFRTNGVGILNVFSFGSYTTSPLLYEHYQNIRKLAEAKILFPR